MRPPTFLLTQLQRLHVLSTLLSFLLSLAPCFRNFHFTKAATKKCLPSEYLHGLGHQLFVFLFWTYFLWITTYAGPGLDSHCPIWAIFHMATSSTGLAIGFRSTVLIFHHIPEGSVDF